MSDLMVQTYPTMDYKFSEKFLVFKDEEEKIVMKIKLLSELIGLKNIEKR